MILRLLFILLPFTLLSQQDGYLSLYTFNMNLMNPAHAGSEEGHVFALSYRNQWNSIENSPRTIGLSYSSSTGKNVGLGVSVISDKIFIENQTIITVDFSYKLSLNDDIHLFLGIKGGGNSYSADPSLLTGYSELPDPTQRSLSKFNPNLGVGFLLKSEKLWVSGSMPRLFNAKRDGDIEIQSKDRQHIFLSGGAVFSISEDFALKPNLMYRKGKGLPNVIDVGSWFSYLNKFDFGVSYRSGSVFSFLASIALGENMSIGYAYDSFSNSTLSGLNLNCHELAIRFKLGEGSGKSNTEEAPAEE